MLKICTVSYCYLSLGKGGNSLILIVYLVLNIPLEVDGVGGRWRGRDRGDGGVCSGWEDEKVSGDLGSEIVLRRVPRGQRGRGAAATVRVIPQIRLSFLICSLSTAEAENEAGIRQQTRQCINKASSERSGWQKVREKKMQVQFVLENISAGVDGKRIGLWKNPKCDVPWIFGLTNNKKKWTFAPEGIISMLI